MPCKGLLFFSTALLAITAIAGDCEIGNDRIIADAFINHAKTYAETLTKEKVNAQCIASPEQFAWVEFRYLECLNMAYELTGNSAYLDLLKGRFELFNNSLTESADPFLGWYGKALESRKMDAIRTDGKIDELQTSFRAIGLLSHWVELARNNTTYAEINQTTIDSMIELMTEHLYPKWDARGFYTQIEGHGGVYHGLDYPSRYDVTLSHEKHAIAVDALLKLHRITGNDTYLKRALEIGTWFKYNLTLVDDHYEWMSWTPAGPWDQSPSEPDKWKVEWIGPDPNAEWYIASLSIALNLYQHGLLFNGQDLERFIVTQKTQCWNGDLEHPEYRTVTGAKNKWVKGNFLSYQLAHYDPVLSQLAFHGPHEIDALNNISNAWKGGANAQHYVREKQIMHPIIKKNPQPYRHIRNLFLSKPENQAFYRALNQP